MAERKKDYPCLMCKKHVKKNDEAGGVQCCQCDLWVHAMTCAGMSRAVFNVHAEVGEHVGSTTWKCASCCSFAAKIAKRVELVEKDVAGVKTKQSEHEVEIGNLKREVAELKAARAADKEVPVTVQRDTKTAVFSELREREQRCHNLVIRGLPEAVVAGAGDEQTARDADMAKVAELIAKLELQVGASAVSTTTRLNNSAGDDDKPRQLLVGFKNSDDRKVLLQAANKLARLPEPWKSVFVSPDLTKWQRQEEQELLKKADEMTQALSEDEAKNWRFRRVGRPGNRKIAKVPVQAGRGRADRTAEAGVVAPTASDDEVAGAVSNRSASASSRQSGSSASGSPRRSRRQGARGANVQSKSGQGAGYRGRGGQ